MEHMWSVCEVYVGRMWNVCETYVRRMWKVYETLADAPLKRKNMRI